MLVSNHPQGQAFLDLWHETDGGVHWTLDISEYYTMA